MLRYIKEIGKDRTILLSTHNLGEVEEACARAIIVSKGASSPTARSTKSAPRPVACATWARSTSNARKQATSRPRSRKQREALQQPRRGDAVRELPTDEKAHKFELSGAQDSDIRAEIYRLVGSQGLDTARASPRRAEPRRRVPRSDARRREARPRALAGLPPTPKEEEGRGRHSRALDSDRR